MRRFLGLLVLIMLSVCANIHARLFPQQDPLNFTFIETNYPSGESRFPLLYGGGTRTSYVSKQSFTETAPWARVELLCDGWQEVPVLDRTRMVFIKENKSATLMAGRLTPESHMPGRKGFDWVLDENVTSLLVDTHEANPFIKLAAKVVRWAGDPSRLMS